MIVKAQAKVNECKASAEVRVATGDEDDLNKVECVVNSAAASDYVVHDACKHAAEDLALTVCDLEDRTTDVLHVQAEVRNALLSISLFPCRPHSYCIPWQDAHTAGSLHNTDQGAALRLKVCDTKRSSGAACILVHRGRLPLSAC